MCETDRVWVGEVSSPSGLGECPDNVPCTFGDDECVENTKGAGDSGVVSASTIPTCDFAF